MLSVKWQDEPPKTQSGTDHSEKKARKQKNSKAKTQSPVRVPIPTRDEDAPPSLQPWEVPNPFSKGTADYAKQVRPRRNELSPIGTNCAPPTYVGKVLSSASESSSQLGWLKHDFKHAYKHAKH